MYFFYCCWFFLVFSLFVTAQIVFLLNINGKLVFQNHYLSKILWCNYTNSFFSFFYNICSWFFVYATFFVGLKFFFTTFYIINEETVSFLLLWFFGSNFLFYFFMSLLYIIVYNLCFNLFKNRDFISIFFFLAFFQSPSIISKDYPA